MVPTVRYEPLVLVALVLFGTTFCIECGRPGWPADGGYSKHKDSYQVGESISYTCRAGYLPIGNNKAACQPNGTWSSPPSICAKDWLRGSGVEMVADSSEEHVYDASDALNANPLLLTDGGYKTCFDIPHNGTTLLVQLPDPVRISVIRLVFRNHRHFQRMNIFVDEQTCHYDDSLPGSGAIELHCREQPVGSRIELKIWSIRFPLTICELQAFSTESERQSCGIPASPVNGDVRDQSVDEFRFTCRPNFDLIGSETVRCIEGRWSSETPRCVPPEVKSTCHSLPEIDNAFIEYDHSPVDDQFPHLTTAAYVCLDGHTLIGNQSRQCIENGWTLGQPVCESTSHCHSVDHHRNSSESILGIDCGPFPDPSYEPINGTGFGAVVEHRCHDSDRQLWYSRCTEGGWQSNGSMDRCPRTSYSAAGWIALAVLLLILTMAVLITYRNYGYTFLKLRYTKADDTVTLELEP